MADKSANPSGAAGRAPVADQPAAIRNVVLVGHTGAGKTTLVESLLVATGTVTRAGRVEDGTTVSDFDEAELRQQRSVSLSLALPGTLPLRDFDEMVAICQRVFGDGVLPLYLPLHADDGTAAGLIGLLSQQVYDYSGGKREERAPDPEHLPLIENARNALIEGVIAESEDESLMDRYLSGEDIETDVLIKDLETAVARGSFYPVLGAALTPEGLGTAELLEVITQAFPSPLEHEIPPVTTPDGKPKGPLTCDPAGPLVAEVVKTTSDPYVGRISLVRVFSGTLRPDATVHVSGHGMAGRGHEDHDVDERMGALSSPLGKAQRTVSQAIAGDLVAVAKLTRAETGRASCRERVLRLV